MTVGRFYPKSERDDRPWCGLPATGIFNAQNLPRNVHELAWESAEWHCAGCPFSTDDLAAAAGHTARSQFIAAPSERLLWPAGSRIHPAGKTGPLNPTKES
jgi:hypothetical protein